MCGIAGIISTNSFVIEASDISKLRGKLNHRGPDGYGYTTIIADNFKKFKNIDIKDVTSSCFMWHSRLAIIDLSEDGAQPIISNDGRFSLVFNGEIYNYIELKEVLQNEHGIVFETNSDTEVLLYAYIVWGKGCLNLLRGMFAFAVFDLKANVLFCARDIFGIKPFYYSIDGNQFMFGSEQKVFHVLKKKKQKINNNYFKEYLEFGLSDFGNETIFLNIHQLSQGEYLEVIFEKETPIRAKKTLYHIFKREEIDISRQEAVTKTRDLITRSLDLHLRSDVAVGAALSGGVDSSSIVCGIHSNFKDVHDLKLFSYVPADPLLSEETYIDAVAKITGFQSIKFDIPKQNIVGNIRQIIKSQDEPFNSVSIFAQSEVFRHASLNKIKVMLDGQGGDELFGGYVQYLIPQLVASIKDGNFVHLNLMLKRFSNENTGVSMRFLINGLLRKYIPLSFHKINDSNNLRNHGVVNFTKGNNIGMERKGFSSLKESMIYDIEKGVLPRLLRYEDRNSMNYSVESRVPFLIKDISDFSLSLPSNLLLGETGRLKSILRDAMAGYLPIEIIARRDKKGFDTPLWEVIFQLRDEVERILILTNLEHIFDYKLLLSLINQEYPPLKIDQRMIWRIVCSILWIDINKEVLEIE